MPTPYSRRHQIATERADRQKTLRLVIVTLGLLALAYILNMPGMQ